MNIEQLEQVIVDCRTTLREGLLATDIFERKSGLSLAGFNTQPVAVALFTQVTEYLETTLRESAFPALDKYFLLDMQHGHVVVRGWPGVREIHIVADKRAASDEQLRRLRVHYLAWASGEITVDTRVDLGGHERALPLTGSRIDLVIDVPAGLEVAAKTFGGDLKVTGLRAGARLETTGGRIEVAGDI